MWGELLGNVAGTDPLVPGVDARKTGQSQRIAGQDHPNELFVRQQGVHIIQGDVLRVEGDNYFIKELGGKALSIRTDAATM